MKLDDFLEIIAEVLVDVKEIAITKNSDYATAEDAFRNMTIHAELVKLLRMDMTKRSHHALSGVLEKVHRCINLEGRKPKHESVKDSVRDGIVFFLLYFGMWLEDLSGE